MKDEAPHIANRAPEKPARLAEQRPGQDPLFRLSFAQERLWFLDQLLPGSPLYNIATALPLPGPLDLAALQRSLDEIVRRHEALRTTFRLAGTEPVQVVASPAPVALPVDDLVSLPEGARQAEARRLAAQEAGHVFDLTRGPLLRARLLRLAATEHLLLLTMHHIVSDGWSLGVLQRELEALYPAYVRGQASPLAPLPIQYADYALWQRSYLSGATLEELLGYWRQQLAGMPMVLEVPTDRRRPAVQRFRGAWRHFEVDAAVSEALQALARQAGVTLFMTLLAAFKVLLYRYTGQDDVVVGTPIANRTRREIEGLIGFFVNTLVLRTPLGGDPSVRALLRRVRTVTLGAYAHQDLPFERLVEALQPERSLSHSPLFQVVFTLQNLPTSAQDGRSPEHAAGTRRAASEPSPDAAGIGTAKFDLSLAMQETGRGLEGTFEYSTDLFDHATITRMIGHFQTLLAGIVADPDQRLSALPLLTAAERRTLLVDWNDTQGDVAHACIHHLFEAQARQTPDALAVVYEDASLTYGALDRRSTQLGHYLRTLGVGPERLVGLCLERSPEMVVAVLGVLKAGGAYVPLDPAYPAERLRFMLEDAGVGVLLTQEALAERLPDHTARVVYLEQVQAEIARQPLEPVEGGADGQTLAYVIYTSGSTGTPKGVMVAHRGLCSLAASQRRVIGLGPSDRTLQFSSLSYDIWMWDFLLAVGAGATLCLAPEAARSGGEALLALIRRQALTAITLLPSVLATVPAAEVASLQTVIVGAEVCPAELVDRWGARYRFFNGYGPTEASVTATMARCLPGTDRPSIGRPFVDVRVYVLDAWQRPVPVGVPGEVYLGGAGLARGYLRRPGLTAERFVPDGLSGVPGARLYRTGDRARYLPDGRLDFLGRLDRQVKLRGYRIELGEIEAVLRQHPSVAACAVVRWEAEPGSERLVAYVVGREAAPSVSALRGYLGDRLPQFMVPAAFEVVEALPRTPSGKVDVSRLPAPELDREAEAAAYVAPRNAVEEALAAIFQEILGIARVGVDDNFFALGGHSLLATQVITRLRDGFRLDVPLHVLFEAPTVAELAAALVPFLDEHEEASVHGAGTEDRVDALLRQLEQLPDDEVEALLNDLYDDEP